MPALEDFGLTLLLGIGFTALLVPASTTLNFSFARSTRR
jgi:hypothetical protein